MTTTDNRDVNARSFREYDHSGKKPAIADGLGVYLYHHDGGVLRRTNGDEYVRDFDSRPANCGRLIVSFIGFRMLFPQPHVEERILIENKTAEMKKQDSPNIAFVPLAMPSTAGPGTIAIIISSAATVKSSDYPRWIITVAPVMIFFLVGMILWISLRSSGAIMRLVGKSGIETISCLMGFLLVCMGVQFVINGIIEIIKTFPPAA